MNDEQYEEYRQFQAWVVVSMERIYDLLLADLYQKYGEEFTSNILADHAEHKYMYPEPSNDGSSAAQPEPSGDGYGIGVDNDQQD